MAGWVIVKFKFIQATLAGLNLREHHECLCSLLPSPQNDVMQVIISTTDYGSGGTVLMPNDRPLALV